MTDTAAATQKAAAAKPASPVIATRREQSLRAAQIRQFVPSSLQTLGLGDFDLLTQTVPAEWSYADCLIPTAWARVVHKVSRDAIGHNTRDYVGSTIRLAHPKFYADVIIKAIVRDGLGQPCGLDVMCIGPAQDPKTGKACPRSLETGLPMVDE